MLVKPAVERVTLSADALTLTAGEAAVLDAAADPEGDVAWLSSDETVAEVSDGTVTAKKPALRPSSPPAAGNTPAVPCGCGRQRCRWRPWP